RLLTKAQAEALTAFAVKVGEYERLMGYPPRTAKSAAFEVGHRGVSQFAVSGELERRARKAKRLHERLLDSIPEGVWRDSVYALAVESRHVSTGLAPGIAQIADAIGAILSGVAKRPQLRRIIKKPRTQAQRAAVLVMALEHHMQPDH